MKDIFAGQAPPQDQVMSNVPSPQAEGMKDIFGGNLSLEPTTTPESDPLPRLFEAYKRGDRMTDRQRSLLDEIILRKGLDMTYGQDKGEDQWGIADYLYSILEPTAMMASGIVAEPVAGLAGIAGAMLPGEEGQGASFVEKTRDALTYEPKSYAGNAAMEGIGEALTTGTTGKVVKGIADTYNAAGDAAYEAGGPIAGAAVKTVISAIPEILGLKGTRAAKKMLLGRVIRKVNPAELYDELGALLPEIKRSLQAAGMTEQEVMDILKVANAETLLKESAGEIGDAATKVIGKEKAAARIAEDVKPSQEILEAAREFGLEDQLLPSHYSQNPVYVAIEQGLKSIPASQLSVREKALLLEMGKKADNLIEEFGGVIDKAGLSDAYRQSATRLVDDLEKQAEKAYINVTKAIPKDSPVDAQNIVDAILKEADELGGVQYLNKVERDLLRDLSPDSNPTYARLDKLRRDLGSAYKGKGMFKDAADADLGRLYGALAEDQLAAAKAAGVGDLYEVGKDLVIARKAIEKQLLTSLGKDLAGNITAKAGLAIKNLAKGDTKAFDQLLATIPKEMGGSAKKQIIATALNDAFIGGSRAEKSLNVAAFDDFVNGIQRNQAARSRLIDVLGEDAVKRMESFHKVVGGVRKAQKESITTGRIMAVPGMLDEQKGLMARLFGTVAKVAAAEGITTTMGAPGVGATGVIVKTLSDARKTVRSIAADELLSSPKFQKILADQARNAQTSGRTVDQALEALEKLKEYQRWKTSLPERDLADLTAVGAIGYFTGEPAPEQGDQL